jgi:pyruvate carboxylase
LETLLPRKTWSATPCIQRYNFNNFSHLIKVTEDFLKFQQTYGNVAAIPTPHFFAPLTEDDEVRIHMDKGKKLFVRMPAVSATLNDKGEREVFFELNGMKREI